DSIGNNASRKRLQILDICNQNEPDSIPNPDTIAILSNDQTNSNFSFANSTQDPNEQIFKVPLSVPKKKTTSQYRQQGSITFNSQTTSEVPNTVRDSTTESKVDQKSSTNPSKKEETTPL